jgi:hypothetical protein
MTTPIDPTPNPNPDDAPIPFADAPELLPKHEGPRPRTLGVPHHTIAVEGEAEPYPLEFDPRLDGPSPRPEHRRFLATILIGTATAFGLGMVLRMPCQLTANDISRWCTVWSLVEKGSYAIDDCPWSKDTQDKVKKPSKLEAPKDDAGRLERIEYALAPKSWKEGEGVDHFYSSKPPLMSTIIAGLIYPARRWTGVPLDRVVDQKRLERNVEKEVPGQPGKTQFVKETPKPVPWPAYVFYFKPILVLFNVVPMLALLVLYARLLDRTAGDDWSWTLCLFTGAMGTLLFAYLPTLNNHTTAAACAFFAIYALQRIWSERERSAWAFAAAGFFGAFTACNELPAALFGLLLFLMLVTRFPGRTLKWFVPAAAIPIVAFLATQYIAFGQFKPVYEEFGTKSYTYEGSYWNTPLEMDYFNVPDKKVVDGKTIETWKEPYEVYLFHMTFGHHGVFSLTPIFLFSLFGAVREIVRRGRLVSVAWLTLLLTAAMLAFYTWNPKARNYGGTAQGLRWLFWLIPFWLAVLPAGVVGGGKRPSVRWLTLLAMMLSMFSVGYAVRNPWSSPWPLDALEHLDLYKVVR